MKNIIKSIIFQQDKSYFITGTTFTITMFFCLNIASCKKFLQIDPPISSLEQRVVFKNDGQATSAVIGMYSNMNAGYASGSRISVTNYAGLSADDMIGYNTFLPFYENQLSPDLSNITTLYSSMYKTIYTSNTIIEGLEESTGVTPAVKAQLEGEAYFIRAFATFYLVNIFGPVPLQLTSDFRVTQLASRAPVDIIYKQIILDLKTAERLLIDSYPSPGRVRPNRSVAQALLARTYLYINDWENAEKYSTLIIDKKSTYNLVGFDAVFLSNSQEAIWQLMPVAGTNAPDGSTFIPTLTAVPDVVSLRPDFVLNTFETSDKRLSSWVKSYTLGSITYYYPFKYKIKSASIASEYSTVFRLAELYLIRAEARINRDDIINGINDVNQIRLRPLGNGSNANVLNILPTNMSKVNALLAVEKERRNELFSEWGHRWFDLKRTSRADIVLGVSKSFWQPTDKLYPIPTNELNRNLNIKQNEGY